MVIMSGLLQNRALLRSVTHFKFVVCMLGFHPFHSQVLFHFDCMIFWPVQIVFLDLVYLLRIIKSPNQTNRLLYLNLIKVGFKAILRGGGTPFPISDLFQNYPPTLSPIKCYGDGSSIPILPK